MSENQPANLSDRVSLLMANAFQVPPAQITPDLAFGDLPQWDSMGHMELMMLLEEQYGIEINTDAIASLVSVPAITQYLEEHNHGAG